MSNNIDTIKAAMQNDKESLLCDLRLDYARNERDANNTCSETIYKAMMNRLRDIRTAIAHIEANDFDAFKDCPIGVFIVAQHWAEKNT